MRKIFPFLLFLSILPCTAAQAAIITVNNTTDGSVSGFCTLRDAIASVNDGRDFHGYCEPQPPEPLGDDTIVFDSSLAGETIVLTDGAIEINADLTITGLLPKDDGMPAITLDGNHSNRIFTITGGRHLAITGVKFAHGNAGDSFGDYGGAVEVDTDSHTLRLTQCVFESNRAWAGGAVGLVNGEGRSKNTVTIAESTFSGNTAVGHGGAVYAGFTATISNSTFNGNRAGSEGGAVETAGATISNSTFSDNHAGQYGGAVWAHTLHASHLTFLDNTADESGQAVYVFFQDLALHNSIIIGRNDKAQCANNPGSAPNFTGLYNLEGHHDDGALKKWVASTATCGTTNIAAMPYPGDVLRTIIASLPADNGGPTETLALPANSPAIGAADPTPIPDDGTSRMWDPVASTWVDATLDQRGFERPPVTHGRSVGAYKGKQGPIPTPIPVVPIPTLPAPLLPALVALMGATAASQRRCNLPNQG